MDDRELGVDVPFLVEPPSYVGCDPRFLDSLHCRKGVQNDLKGGHFGHPRGNEGNPENGDHILRSTLGSIGESIPKTGPFDTYPRISPYSKSAQIKVCLIAIGPKSVCFTT